MLYKKTWYMAIIFMLPFALFAGVFLFYPALVNVINSFFRFTSKLDTEPLFVGWKNFTYLFVDNENFYRSLTNTLVMIVCIIVFQVGIALLLALLVNNLSKGSSFFRIVFFMPIVISATAIGLLYLIFIQPDGLFTQVLGKEMFNWLPPNNPLALITVMVPVIWQYIGFYFVILLTGLTNIPEDILEAARIDGASKLRINFLIMLPMLWNVFRTCMVLAITGALKVFDLPHVIAPDGQPGKQTIFMGTYNNWLYSANRIGESAVYSLLIVFAGILVSSISNAVLRENKDIQ